MRDYYTYEGERHGLRQDTRAAIEELVFKPMVASSGRDRKDLAFSLGALAACFALVWALGWAVGAGWLR